MPAFIDLTGQKFGRLTAVERAKNNRHNQPMWRCRCECGALTTVVAGALRGGTTKSCGCLVKDAPRLSPRHITHGKSKTPTWFTWVNIRDKRRAGVHPRWLVFENFLADMGERPSDDHTIDRINNARGYEPGNCRWATQKEQQNNRTNNRQVTAFGKTQNLQQWSDEFGLSHKVISYRLKSGWPPEDAVSLPTSPLPRSRRAD